MQISHSCVVRSLNARLIGRTRSLHHTVGAWLHHHDVLHNNNHDVLHNNNDTAHVLKEPSYPENIRIEVCKCMLDGWRPSNPSFFCLIYTQLSRKYKVIISPLTHRRQEQILEQCICDRNEQYRKKWITDLEGPEKHGLCRRRVC